jgi:hypothetical protein
MALVYNADTPLLKQPNPWACSVFSATMAFRSLGKTVDWQTVRGWLGSRVTEEQGLIDARGVGLAQLFREHGLVADYRGRTWANPLAFADIAARAGKQPLLLGGVDWNHWTFVRRKAPNGTLALGNPADGHMGVHQQLTPQQFNALGPFSLVWIEVGEEEDRVKIAELEDKVAGLTVALAHVCDDLVEDILAKGPVTDSQRQAIVNEAKHVREQFLGPRP